MATAKTGPGPGPGPGPGTRTTGSQSAPQTEHQASAAGSDRKRGDDTTLGDAGLSAQTHAASPRDKGAHAPPSAAPLARKRAKNSAARRDAILAAALDEFTDRGFSSTRIDDIARRAGVGKGTIYLHFRDKDALFQELVTTMLGPLVARLEKLPLEDVKVRPALERLFALFVNDVFGTKRRDVLRLVMAEGPRFPPLAEFYYDRVVGRAFAALRCVLDRAHARGELSHDRLSEYPQLVMAPAITAIIWSGLFDRFAPLDIGGLLRAHLDILFGPEGES